MDFTSNLLNDELFISDFDKEDTPKMILYAFLDNKTAMSLFKYYIGLGLNITSKYKNSNPLQVPITLYETPYIAKLHAAQNNSQLVAFNINTNTENIYDEFNIGLHTKLKQLKISIDEYKSKVTLLREEKSHNKYKYIAYTLKDKAIIKEIQLQDYKTYLTD